MASARDLANAAFFGLDCASVEERAKVIHVPLKKYFVALDWVKLNWTSKRKLTLSVVEEWASAYYRQNTWEEVWEMHPPDEIVRSLDQALGYLAITPNRDIEAKTYILGFEFGEKGVPAYFWIPIRLAGVFVQLRYHVIRGYGFETSLGDHRFTTYGELETALLSCINQVET